MYNYRSFNYMCFKLALSFSPAQLSRCLPALHEEEDISSTWIVYSLWYDTVDKVEKCSNFELIFISIDTCQYVLDTLTDVTEEYIQKFTRLLRIAVDQESMSGPTGFPVCIQTQSTQSVGLLVHKFLFCIFMFSGEG